ncbi:hypothetical protein ACPC54_18055 [Kitasatospora sp. NPDC094028]
MTLAQWRAEVCVVGTDCSGRLDYVGDLYNATVVPSDPWYRRAAYAHIDCLRPEERYVPAHSRCQPTITQLPR